MAQLSERIRAGEGFPLIGKGGLLPRLIKQFVEAAAQGEMDAHLGYARHEPGRPG